MRIEKDSLGEVQLPEEALYGIHSERARQNFPDHTPFPIEWYKALAQVKQACYITAIDFIKKAQDKIDLSTKEISLPKLTSLTSLSEEAAACAEGRYYEHFVVPAISGGAGTSFNMNMNEILANAALVSTGHKAGEYEFIDPVEDANIFQSTNDVVPTSLHLAGMQVLTALEDEINLLRAETEKKEQEYRNTLRIAYTQMQEAVPTTYGRLFSSYSDALSRDWWRISKCLERIKVVNLGGSAIGTSITVPKYFVLEVVKNLQQLSGLPLTRAENLSDATSNLDTLVEVHGILKAHAVNLEKMVSDLRLLSSNLHGDKELQIPKKQVGSSIMPGKVNPVIPEFVISAVNKVYANDQLITRLAGQGCLELNAYLPTIGQALLESIKLLMACNASARENLVSPLVIDAKLAEQKVLRSPSIATALVPFVGYNKATELAVHMNDEKVDVFTANQELKLLADEKLKDILKPENLVQGGYLLKDLED